MCVCSRFVRRVLVDQLNDFMATTVARVQLFHVACATVMLHASLGR